jgi:glycosyltransferase involved in cell wall biosynthesis
LAIQIAQKAGVPLKIAGEVQPIFRDYFEKEIKPHLDGKFIEYIGEADLETKNELLGNSAAMLFPIQWDEPFGLVMIEAMACGTPVLALPGGSVAEVVKDGISGWIGRSPDELAQRAATVDSDFVPAKVRDYVARKFSLERMASEYAKCYREALNRGLAEVPAIAAG